MGRLKYYLELFKVKQSALLILSGIFGYLIAAGSDIDINVLSLFIVASILSIFGTTGINMYYDKEIDAKMFRTMNRPLPARKLDPVEAHAVSITLTLIGVGLGFLINIWVGISILIGFIVDAYVYTALLKKRTALNIVVGAIAGGMPIFGGYVAYTGSPDLKALFLALIIMIWAILHIWFIAIYYLDDYKRANIPMLPVVIGPRKTVIISIPLSMLMTGIIYLMYMFKMATILPVICSTVLEIGIIYVSLRYLVESRREIARKIFKFLSPYQVLVLTVLYIEHFVTISIPFIFLMLG